MFAWLMQYKNKKIIKRIPTVKNSAKQCDKKYCEGGGVQFLLLQEAGTGAFFLWHVGVWAGSRDRGCKL